MMKLPDLPQGYGDKPMDYGDNPIFLESQMKVYGRTCALAVLIQVLDELTHYHQPEANRIVGRMIDELP